MILVDTNGVMMRLRMRSLVCIAAILCHTALPIAVGSPCKMAAARRSMATAPGKSWCAVQKAAKARPVSASAAPAKPIRKCCAAKKAASVSPASRPATVMKPAGAKVGCASKTTGKACSCECRRAPGKASKPIMPPTERPAQQDRSDLAPVVVLASLMCDAAVERETSSTAADIPLDVLSHSQRQSSLAIWLK